MRRMPAVLLVALVPFVIAQVVTSREAAAAPQATGAPSTRILHTPVTSFTPGSRMLVWAEAVDDSPITVFRCYFREAGNGDFWYVDMAGAGANRYVAFLPAPSPRTEAIEYVLLAATARREVVRTGTFTMTRAGASHSGLGPLPPHLGDQTERGEVYVTQDLPQAQSSLPGFDDRVVLVGTAPDKRFGQVVHGLYDARRRPRDGWPSDCLGYDIVAKAPGEPLPNTLPTLSGTWDETAAKLGDDIKPPQALREAKPRYTAAAMRAKIQGTAVVECIVEPDGTVGPARLLKSFDPVFGLDYEAVLAARQWRFTPATRGGQPLPVVVSIELCFQLR